MKIVLNKNIENVGSVGDVVAVKDGFARNFLIPEGSAVLATPGNIKVIEQEKSQEIAVEKKNRVEAEKIAEKIRTLTLSHEVSVGEEGKLFGAVTAIDIVQLLGAAGVEVDKKNIRMAKSIRKIGEYDIEVRCYNSVKAIFKFWVLDKDKDAKEAKAEAVALAAKEAAEIAKKAAEAEAAANPESTEVEAEASTETVDKAESK
ncbi:MAG: large subunit ribosomal protein L9 [Candidatus Omnitrophota bacterium]|jgi:large subunit ribosomal protein L9